MIKKILSTVIVIMGVFLIYIPLNFSIASSALDNPSSISEEHIHNYVGEITQQPSCTEDGVEVFTCECGDSYTEIIPATGHDYVTSEVPATYFEQGYTIHTCSVCGDSYTDNYTEKLVLPTVNGFKVTSNTVNSVSLTWDKVEEAQGYIVYRYDLTNKTWTRIEKTNTTSNSYLVSNLNAGTTYIFAVKAYITVDGREVTSISYPKLTASTKPENVTGFKSAATSNTKVKLTWNKVSGAQGYIVYRYDAAKKLWVRVEKTKTASNAYFVTGLKAGTTYKFAVKAYRNINGKEITSEKYPTVITSTTPFAVNFKMKAYPQKVDVSWSKVPGASGYIVYYKTSANGKWQRLKLTTGTSYTKTGLKKDRNYWFTVRAYKTVSGKHYYGTFATKSIKTDYCYSAKKSSVEKKAASILDSIAKQNNIDTPTLYMAYNWSKMHYVKNKTNPNLGTEWFADIGLTYHNGNCYVMAATFTEFAKLLGYNAVQISGDVPLRIGGTGPHSWVEIIINNTVYVCDPDLEYEFGTNHYMFKYHPISSGSSYYIVGDGKHVKYHRIRTMK